MGYTSAMRAIERRVIKEIPIKNLFERIEKN